MKDTALLLILLGLAWLVWLRPWLGVLGLALLSAMHPQGYATGYMAKAPVYLFLFVWTSICALYQHLRAGGGWRLPWQRLADWRIYGLALLWVWFGISSQFALAPWEAWPKFLDTLKILPPLLLVLWLIDTRDKLQALLAVVALAIVLVAIKGGYWAVLSGFQDRVYGPPGSQHEDNNSFAVAVAMAIPLAMFWLRQARAQGLRLVLMLGLAAAYASVLSSWSRGGMLALAVVTLLMVWHSPRKWLAVPLFLGLLGVLFIQLPDQWFGRMETMASYGSDESAQGRLAAWKVGLEVAAQRPLVGGGFNAWPVLTAQTAGGLDWHSAYIEVLAEHGYGGLGLWLAVFLGSLLSMGWRRGGLDPWTADARAMIQASLAAYLVGGLTLGLAYWDLPYLLLVMAVLTRQLPPQRTP